MVEPKIYEAISYNLPPHVLLSQDGAWWSTWFQNCRGWSLSSQLEGSLCSPSHGPRACGVKSIRPLCHSPPRGVLVAFQTAQCLNLPRVSGPPPGPTLKNPSSRVLGGLSQGRHVLVQAAHFGSLMIPRSLCKACTQPPA